MNIHYDLVNQFPIQQKGVCFVLFLFILFLFCCFCFVFVCLFVFSMHLKSWNKWCSHTKTSKLLRKWEIQNGGLDNNFMLRLSTTVVGWTYYFAGSFPNLSKPLDRGHDFFWIFFKVTKTLLGVTHKGWGLKCFFDSPIRRVGLEQKLPKVFPVKIKFIYMICYGVDL